MSTRTPSSMQTFHIGDIRVTKVLDTLEPTSPRVLFVDKRKDDFDPHLDWLQPHFLDAGKGHYGSGCFNNKHRW